MARHTIENSILNLKKFKNVDNIMFIVMLLCLC